MRFLGSAVVFSLVLQTMVRMVFDVYECERWINRFSVADTQICIFNFCLRVLQAVAFFIYMCKYIQIHPTVYASLFFLSVWTARRLADGHIHL